MKNRKPIMTIRLLMYLFVTAILLLGFMRLVAVLTTRSQIYPIQEIPAARVAIVFGAGLWKNGSPTPVLQDRVQTAVQLYFDNKVEKLLMSGDNRFVDYNEPAAMRNYAISLGVPDQAIVLDYAGRRTYDTCYRAKAIFGVKQAILVTQKYHLPRALFLCNKMGIPSTGVAADRRIYRRGPYLYWNLREIIATATAMWEASITHPLPVLGDPEPIFPAESGSPKNISKDNAS
jgi:SanA protein